VDECKPLVTGGAVADRLDGLPTVGRLSAGVTARRVGFDTLSSDDRVDGTAGRTLLATSLDAIYSTHEGS
jgi:hypothetical protein